MHGQVRVLAEGTGPVVLWCPPAGVAPGDPDPGLTAARGVTLLGTPPNASTVELIQALRERVGGVQVVGCGDGGLRAAEIAGLAPELVGRLVMVAAAVPKAAVPEAAVPEAAAPEAAAPEAARFEVERIAAKTLLLYGAKDSAAPPRDGKWWKQRIPDSRYEQVPGDGPLLIETIWRRALSHLAPGRLKRSGGA